RKTGVPQARHAACALVLARLTRRLYQGLDTRCQGEFDLKRSPRLDTVPSEFVALCAPLLEAIVQLFVASQVDAPQLNNTLSGV
ncbi:hypothetical protein QK887_25785, partial [Salmonella enterica subsp. enterica serovar Oslo]